MFTASIIHKNKSGNNLNVYGWIKKIWYMQCIQFIHKEKEILSFAITWMKFEDILSEKKTVTERKIQLKTQTHSTHMRYPK